MTETKTKEGSRKSVSGSAFDFPILTRIFNFVKPYRKIFIISIFLTVLLAFLAPSRPLLIQYTFDNFISINDSRGLLYMTLILIGLLILQAVMQYFQTYLTSFLGQSVVRDLRVKLYRHILNFRLKYFDKTAIGTPVTRTVSDTETISDMFSDGIIIIIGDLLQLVVVITVMMWIDVKLTLVSLATIPLLVIATNIFKNKIKDAFKDVRTQVARMNVFLQEHITGMNIVQIFNREVVEMERFKEINKAHRDANNRSIWYYSIFFPVVEILSAASIGLLVWWGAKEVLADHLTIGVLIAFILYINMLFRPIRELADKFNTLQMGMVSSERIFHVLDTVEVISNEGKRDASQIKGTIKFENVWFAYNDEDWVLKNVSFEAKAGETIALVGATGAGKSSIINLINRFYQIQKGKILIDGIDIKEYELSSLRSRIAVVLQDVFLFSDTIKNNISLRNPEITEKEIIEASEKVGAHKFIEQVPGMYEYNVRERGGMLSVGQRQMISFIRAYVYKPAILILDEATSSIDHETEELIQQATEKLTENRTSIIIAHRLATIQTADKIIVLDHGEIKETGTHQQLLRLGGMYKHLYEIQFERLVV
ncbi:MAG: ABC transporter ATP-binding protein [Bacteroidia bacterium]